ncbi:MAG TPA: hypothetical protein VGF09_01105 [Solirubrobacterales bacterium]
MRSRLQIALALCAVAALGAGLAACGGGGGSSEESPQAVIESATLEGIESANVDLSLSVKSTGKEGSNLDVSVSGPFESQEGSSLPQMAIEATAKGKYKGEDVDFDGGLVLLPNSAFVKYEGVEYEVDPTTFSFVESIIDRSQKGTGGESKGITGCRQAVGGLDFTRLGEHLKNEGTVEVGGTDTTKLSGDLDPTGASDLLSELSEDPACRTLLGAAGKIPSVGNLKKSGDELSESLKTAHVEFYVGEDDHIVRRVVAELLVEPKGSKMERSEVDLDLTLEGVNEEQEIVAPSAAKPLSDLFLKLGINPLELAGSLQRGEGIQSLLKQLGKKGGGLPNLFGGGQSGEGGEGTSGAGGGAERALSYAECVKGARSAADLQKCVAAL